MEPLHIPGKLLMYKDYGRVKIEIHDLHRRLVQGFNRDELLEIIKWGIKCLGEELEDFVQAVHKKLEYPVIEEEKEKYRYLIDAAEDVRKDIEKIILRLEDVKRAFV